MAMRLRYDEFDGDKYSCLGSAQRPGDPRRHTRVCGTRVPLRTLIDYLERGHSLDEFLDAFPSVARAQAIAALEAAHEALSAGARAAR
jgi:uncharacterized protein (DUF433 family)